MITCLRAPSSEVENAPNERPSASARILHLCWELQLDVGQLYGGFNRPVPLPELGQPHVTHVFVFSILARPQTLPVVMIGLTV